MPQPTKRAPKFAALTVEHITTLLTQLWAMLALDEVRDVLAAMTEREASEQDGRTMFHVARARIEAEYRARMLAAENAGTGAAWIHHVPRSVPASTYTTLALVHPPLCKRLARNRVSLRTIRSMLALSQQKEWREVTRVTPSRTVCRYARKWLHRSTEPGKPQTRGLDWHPCADSPLNSVVTVDGKWRQLRNHPEARLLAFVLTQLQRAEQREAGRTTYATLPAPKVTIEPRTLATKMYGPHLPAHMVDRARMLYDLAPVATMRGVRSDALRFRVDEVERLQLAGHGAGTGKPKGKRDAHSFHAPELADELNVYDGADARTQFAQRLAPQVLAPSPRGNAGLAWVDRSPAAAPVEYIRERSSAVQDARRAECEALQARRLAKGMRLLAAKRAAEA